MGHEFHLVNVSEEVTSEASAGIEPNGVVVHGEPLVVLLGVNSETARVLNSSLILGIPIVEPLVVLLLLDDEPVILAHVRVARVLREISCILSWAASVEDVRSVLWAVGTVELFYSSVVSERFEGLVNGISVTVSGSGSGSV